MSAFDKIIGYELIKEELKQIADCLKHTDKYRKMGVSIPRGLLLEGRPGVGKTLMATCLVEESGRRAFICRKYTSDGSFIKQRTSLPTRIGTTATPRNMLLCSLV